MHGDYRSTRDVVRARVGAVVRAGPAPRRPARSLASSLIAALSLLSALSSRATAGIDGVPTSIAGFVGMSVRGELDRPVRIDSWDEFAATFGEDGTRLANPYLAPSVSAFFANGGRRAYVVRVTGDGDDSYIGAVDAATGRATGLMAIREVDDVSIVTIPGVVSLRVQNALIAHCEALGDRLAVLDAENAASIDPVLRQRAGLRSPRGYAALYYPWVTVEADGGQVHLPPSGFVAGVYARTDREQGVWKSPVGVIEAAQGASRTLDPAEQDTLNTAGISTIRAFRDGGVQVWGARTVASDSEWQYVAVRRFALFLEESIHEGTQWAVFEPNSEELWSRLREDVSAFLVALFQDGAFPGATPDEAFFVRVDRSTMTQEDIDAGRTVIMAGVAPLRPGEFIVIRIVHERSSTAARFRRGDANGDAVVDISDPVRILEFLFLGGAAPPCLDAADTTDEGRLTISSAVSILDYLFRGGKPMPPPFPGCGVDPTQDALGECEDHARSCG